MRGNDDKLCIENEELCVKNEGLCIESDEFCRSTVAPLLLNLEALSPTAAATGTAETPAAETLGASCHYGMILYFTTLDASQAAQANVRHKIMNFVLKTRNCVCFKREILHLKW